MVRLHLLGRLYGPAWCGAFLEVDMADKQNEVCQNCGKKMFGATVFGKYQYGHKGDGLFCSEHCGYEWAVANQKEDVMTDGNENERKILEVLDDHNLIDVASALDGVALNITGDVYQLKVSSGELTRWHSQYKRNKEWVIDLIAKGCSEKEILDAIESCADEKRAELQMLIDLQLPRTNPEEES